MLTDDDRDDFIRAVELIQTIVSRHSTDVTAPTLVALQIAVHDIGVVRKYLDAGNTERC